MFPSLTFAINIVMNVAITAIICHHYMSPSVPSSQWLLSMSSSQLSAIIFFFNYWHHQCHPQGHLFNGHLCLQLIISIINVTHSPHRHHLFNDCHQCHLPCHFNHSCNQCFFLIGRRVQCTHTCIIFFIYISITK